MVEPCHTDSAMLGMAGGCFFLGTLCYEEYEHWLPSYWGHGVLDVLRCL